MLTSQDYSPSSVVYVPELIYLAEFSNDRNTIGCCDFFRILQGITLQYSAFTLQKSSSQFQLSKLGSYCQ